jgi:glyoxylase-like metal-dependent hydrolase (beta-lactamase superfamily II)
MNIKNVLLSVGLILTSLVSIAKSPALNLKVYTPGHDAIFNVASTIVYGKKDAMLVDGQFQKKYAEDLVKEIKGLKKNLKTIYVSHYDPDYYFGLDVIHKAFPEARIIASPQTAYMIEVSKDSKINTWKGQLGVDAPDSIIVPETTDTIPDLEGNKIEIKQRKEDPAHSYLWIPSLKTILGGIYVSTGEHLWMADTKTMKGIEKWRRALADMKALRPSQVIPSHSANSDFSPVNLDIIDKYLADFTSALKNNEHADGVIAAMKAAYPNLSGEESLALGAKVYKGEAEWKTFDLYPAVGRSIKVDFGAFAFRNSFKDAHHMTFLGLNGGYKGVTDSVITTVVEVSPNVYMVYWSEPNSTKSNVVHVQNYNTGTVWTNIAAPDGKFYNMKGKLTLE